MHLICSRPHRDGIRRGLDARFLRWPRISLEHQRQKGQACHARTRPNAILWRWTSIRDELIRRRLTTQSSADKTPCTQGHHA